MGRLNQRGSAGDGELPRGWTQPEADSSAGGWSAPGQRAALGDTHGTGDVAHPFECSVCGAHMRVEGAYAKNGSTYCFSCKPSDAMTSFDLERAATGGDSGSSWRWLAWILELLMFFFD